MKMKSNVALFTGASSGLGQAAMERLAKAAYNVKLALCSLAVLTLAAVLPALPVRADEASPAGLGKNVDDVSGKPRALIRITESNGALQSKIEKVTLVPNEDPNPKCDKCEGGNKNAPVVGLVILNGLAKEGDEYVGGQILDLDNGKVYRSKVRLTDNGKTLSIRGYIGVPMLGRSKTLDTPGIRKTHESICS